MLQELYNHEYYWVIISIISFFTGIIGAMGGSGALILTPVMMITGMPAQMAIGTLKLSSLGMWTIAALKFKQADKIDKTLALPLCLLAVLGGGIGAAIANNIDEKFIYPVIGAVLLILAPLGLMNRKFGIETIETTSLKRIIGFTLFFLVMIFGGFFGGGAGLLVVYTLVGFMGLTALQAHATDTPAWLLLAIVSSAVFVLNDNIDYRLCAELFTGMTAGGWLGTHLAIKGGDRIVKIFVSLSSILIGVKLLWDYIASF
ncbi:MAG: TSUP family transporter [Alphaproteobacteria bacterium]|nr:TSUP family transporter [Alphaproteobacteria bacterium]